MHIYIPLGATLVFFHIYVLIGVILYFPLFMQQNRFISGGTAWNGWDNMTLRTLFKGIGITMVAWPIILGYNIKTEIEYRKKGYLPK